MCIIQFPHSPSFLHGHINELNTWFGNFVKIKCFKQKENVKMQL